MNLIARRILIVISFFVSYGANSQMLDYEKRVIQAMKEVTGRFENHQNENFVVEEFLFGVSYHIKFYKVKEVLYTRDYHYKFHICFIDTAIVLVKSVSEFNFLIDKTKGLSNFEKSILFFLWSNKNHGEIFIPSDEKSNGGYYQNLYRLYFSDLVRKTWKVNKLKYPRKKSGKRFILYYDLLDGTDTLYAVELIFNSKGFLHKVKNLPCYKNFVPTHDSVVYDVLKKAVKSKDCK